MINGANILQTLLRRGQRDLPEVSDTRLKKEGDFLDSVKDHLARLEEIRREKYKTYVFRKRLSVPAAIVLTPVLAYADYWLLWFQRGNDDSAAGLSVAFLGVLYAWVVAPRLQYARAYKEKILPTLAKLFGDFSYAVGGKIPMMEMLPSKILPAHDKYEAEDYFEGTYKGVHMRFAEIDLKERRRSKNRTYYVSVFKGLAVLLDMKRKKFYGHTILDRNKSRISEWFHEKSTGLKRANLVDPRFEDVFDAYTNDQVEARYLIDPAMMERLVAMYETYNGDKMAAAFYDNKMLILIASAHNYFEPADLSVSATDPRSVLSMKDEIGGILSVIDRLDLYDPAYVHETSNMKEKAST